MPLNRQTGLQVLVVFLSLGIVLVLGHLGAVRLVHDQQIRQLETLNRVALRRAESLADHGIKALDLIARSGPLDCTPAAMQAARLNVYRHGPIKDIRAVTRTGTVRCSAYPETLEFDKQWVTAKDMLETGRPGYRIFRVEQFFSNALGVLRETGDNAGIVAIVGVGPSLFDILPQEIAGASAIELKTADGRLIAGPDELPRDSVVLTATSARYPLSTTLAVPHAALKRWNTEAYWPVLVLAGLLGLVSGSLCWRMLRRSDDPLVEIDRAIARSEFRPYYQPIFSLETGAIEGAEVLLRWARADGAVWSPYRFLELAEASGRIETITWQVVAAALAEMTAPLKAARPFKLSFNIVPKQFIEPGFVDRLAGLVSEAGVEASRVTLEITEREPIEDIAEAARAVAECHEHGFVVAIDDVGIGHSGLSQIQSLPVDCLKVDKFFVDAINDDAAAPIVVEMLVRLARERGMGIVAEGIERVEQARTLLDCGVGYGQGYLVSPPVSGLRFLTLYAETGRAGAPAWKLAGMTSVA